MWYLEQIQLHWEHYQANCPVAPYTYLILNNVLFLIVFLLWRNAAKNAIYYKAQYKALKDCEHPTVESTSEDYQDAFESALDTVKDSNTAALQVVHSIHSEAINALRISHADAMNRLSAAHTNALSTVNEVVTAFTEKDE